MPKIPFNPTITFLEINPEIIIGQYLNKRYKEKYFLVRI